MKSKTTINRGTISLGYTVNILLTIILIVIFTALSTSFIFK